MRRDRRLAFVWLALVWWAGASAADVQAQSARQDPQLSVEVRGGPAQPGSVLALTVTATSDVEGVTAQAFGRTAKLVREGAARVWLGLIGVDLDTTESSTLVVTASLPDGQTATVTQRLPFETRRFPTRRLRVAGQFVDPSPEELERIRLEAARLNTIFATVTVPDRIVRVSAPIEGVPGSNFGTRSIFNGEPRAPHAGTDFRGRVGTPIAAPGAGRVVLAEPLFFTGNTVIIDHGVGLYSLLAHLSRIDVSAGQTVARGDTVGRLGATGRVTGPHLHWTVRLGEARVDPMRLLAVRAATQAGTAVRRPEGN